jgi:hypothetical protein
MQELKARGERNKDVKADFNSLLEEISSPQPNRETNEAIAQKGARAMRVAVILCPRFLLLDEDGLIPHLVVLQDRLSTDEAAEMDGSQVANCLLHDFCSKMVEHRYEVSKIRS